MNHIYFGRSCDLNIGNGKTLSAVRLALQKHLLEGKIIFSNIKLRGVDYTPFTPDSVEQVLETQGAVVIFDEIHAILFKNHRIGTTCKNHPVPGLCFQMIEFFRQVRKRGITTISTAQTFADAHFQLRTVMQEMVICEKFHIEKGAFKKCETDVCPSWHGRHFIKQTNYRNGDVVFIEPECFYDMYDSSEIVKGWV